MRRQRSKRLTKALSSHCVIPTASRYTWTNFSTAQLSHLKKFFNELLFDPLPVLQDLARAIAENNRTARNTNAPVTKRSLL